MIDRVKESQCMTVFILKMNLLCLKEHQKYKKFNKEVLNNKI